METLSEILGGMLTTKQVAERLDISVAKVHRLILKGILVPSLRLDGRTGRYYFKAADIEELAAAS